MTIFRTDAQPAAATRAVLSLGLLGALVGLYFLGSYWRDEGDAENEKLRFVTRYMEAAK